MASFRWLLQVHKDVPKAARFYAEGLGFTVNVCTFKWAELQSGPLKLALMQSSSDVMMQKGYASLLSFTVTDINATVAKLMSLGAELDGPLKYEVHGKVLCYTNSFHRAVRPSTRATWNVVKAWEYLSFGCTCRIDNVLFFKFVDTLADVLNFWPEGRQNTWCEILSLKG